MNVPKYPDAKQANSFQEGLEYQDFVLEHLAKNYGLVFQTFSSRAYQWGKGEGVQPFEIKLDNWCTTSRRLSIEIAEKTRADNPNWIPSGIMREDETLFYIHGNKETFWIFFKKHLTYIFEHEAPEVFESRGTIRKFYIPIERADKLGVRIDCKKGKRNAPDTGIAGSGVST